jgi:hypothetical protein
MSKIRFNKSNIENIEAKERRFKIYSDECRGLYVEVYPSGHKTYRVRYKINQRDFHYFSSDRKNYLGVRNTLRVGVLKNKPPRPYF